VSRGEGADGPEGPRLRELRTRIDALDRRIVGLLNERAELARAAGEEKALLGQPVRDEAREREVLLRVSMANEGPTPQADLLEVYRLLIETARELESRGRARAGHIESESESESDDEGDPA
jgi:chorismate mutase/prephenate dehydratase